MQVVQPFFTLEKFVDQLKEKRFAFRTETMESAEAITLTPKDLGVSFLHFAWNELLSALLVNFSLDNISLQEVSVPLIDSHINRIKRCFLLHFFDNFEELHVVV